MLFDTKVNIGVAVSIMTTVLGGSFWVNSRIANMDNRLQNLSNELTYRLDKAEIAVEAKTNDVHTKSQAAEVALRNAVANPGIKFADPRDPTSLIVVLSK